MRRTKIICTIGPATNSKEMIEVLVQFGMNIARLNFSHGEKDDHKLVISTIREVSADLSKPVGILQDLQGPKIRVGKFENGSVNLIPESEFTITTKDILGNQEIVSTTYKNLPNDVRVGQRILLDDGLIQLVVSEKNDTDVKCKVIVGGILKNNKGINLPETKVSSPSLTEKDIEDLKFGLSNGVDFVALSFVRTPDDIEHIKKLIKDEGYDVPVIAKIEKREAIKNIDSIIDIADGIMVARGDLGVELSNEEVPLLQKMIIQKCNQAGKPVITATQMLESMINNPTPTRAEASDVANAVLDSTDAVMLSGETAVGKYPLLALQVMGRIIDKVEDMILQREVVAERKIDPKHTITDSICHAACEAAEDLDAKLILPFSRTGNTALFVSKYRPRIPILAMTTDISIRRRMALYWGVDSVLVKKMDSTDEMIDMANNVTKSLGLVQKGDKVVITAGTPLGVPGATNMIKVHTIL